MLRKKKSNNRPIAEINVVPYIDVMLVLLVIFMITAPMLTQGVTVDLPKTTSETLNTNEREPIIVSVDRNGQYFLNINNNPNEVIDEQNLLVRISAEIQLANMSKQALSVLVKGDTAVNYGSVVRAMALLKQAGATQVGLITNNLDEKS